MRGSCQHGKKLNVAAERQKKRKNQADLAEQNEIKQNEREQQKTKQTFQSTFSDVFNVFALLYLCAVFEHTCK